MPTENILIIEDDPAMLRGLKDNFEFKGFAVQTASEGETGLHLALTSDPDLILLDIMLPRVNGYEICAQVRASGSQVPIIMLTANSKQTISGSYAKPNTGIHVLDKDNQIRGGTQTDHNGQYTLTVFPEPYRIVPDIKTQSLHKLIGIWKGELKGLSKHAQITCTITQIDSNTFSLTLADSSSTTTTTDLMRENDQIFFSIINPTGRFVGTFKDSLLEGSWHDGSRRRQLTL